MRMASVAPARAVAAGDHVGIASASARPRAMNSVGTLVMRRPNTSRICVLAISTAMPLVKPITTGCGMNFTAEPAPVAPITIRMTPAIIVHMNRPSIPYCATMPAMMTTNAPVGPPI